MSHLQEIGKVLAYYSSKYENFIVFGDFNAEMANPHRNEFCALYNFTNLIKEPTCYKNIDKLTFIIDLILTNHARCFQHSSIYETGLSDFLNFNSITFRMDVLKEFSFSKL